MYILDLKKTAKFYILDTKTKTSFASLQIGTGELIRRMVSFLTVQVSVEGNIVVALSDCLVSPIHLTQISGTCKVTIDSMRLYDTTMLK